MAQSDTGEPAPTGIGALLRQWRTERGLSQSALAARAGIAASTLSRWEAGITSPGIPEWRSTLRALGMPTHSLRETLPLLAAPRAVKQLRSDTASCAPPVGGDLLRAMRLRRGITQVDLASRIGMPQNAIARWERSETWPDNARLQTLCYHLAAYPEEMTALTVGRFSLANLLEISDPDALHVEQWRIRVQSPFVADAALKDLRFLALEGRLHSLLSSGKTPGRDERLQRILSWTYSRHAQYLLESGRTAESVTPARRALTLQKPLWSSRNHEGWVPAVVALAAAEARTGGGHSSAGVRRGLEVFQCFLDHAYTPEYRAWLLTEMAQCNLRAGRVSEAIQFSHDALRSVTECDAEELGVERHLRQRDHASLLLAAGLPSEAVSFLPLAVWDEDPYQNAQDLLVQAEVWNAVKDAESSSATLRKVYAILDAHQVMATPVHANVDRVQSHWQDALRTRADLLAQAPMI